MIKLKNINNTCSACPSQWEGLTDDGKEFYARYRWGYLSVDIDGEEVFGVQHGGGLDGFLSYLGLRELTKSVIDWDNYPTEFINEY